MTLKEYYKKYDNIEKTHPKPEGAPLSVANAHYRKIIESWQKELSPKDLEEVLKEERHFAEKMASQETIFL